MSDDATKLADVHDLNAHIPLELREAAKRAYEARLQHRKAQEEAACANRAFSAACKRFNIDPSSILVGELDGRSLVPADHYGPLPW